MASGTKRDREGKPREDVVPRGRFHAMFEQFRDELDEHHDRRERIIKASRDVTAHSKKIVKTINRDLPANTWQEVNSRTSQIATLLESVKADLQDENRDRYSWQMRGMEELVEALSLSHYLRTQKLISPAEAQAAVPADVSLTTRDYLFGVLDLFGELMRFATVHREAVLPALHHHHDGDGESNDEESHRRPVLRDLQELACTFEALPPASNPKDWYSKLEAMRQSVRKVEDLGYGLVVRGSERPSGWLPEAKDEEMVTVV
ncbi:hypothetical protein L249_7809 [Ophiocordyceps polyrhachis-furcata BCC 54312]|uniref:Translin n=1 Tax=Ophiocordyceps polyrhachis-furcata BCC 54312 TaxID=1330021 RepID=A0A367L0X0_9HYPO|nr:hypothetical protein L249_7809 [Ophiocordyceps polyrhachis-furcata BCC 54312]